MELRGRLLPIESEPLNQLFNIGEVLRVQMHIQQISPKAVDLERQHTGVAQTLLRQCQTPRQIHRNQFLQFCSSSLMKQLLSRWLPVQEGKWVHVQFS
ncbi:hypothetical protein D3C81_1959430 [compost metagenome]